MIMAAKRPLLLIASGANRHDTHSAVRRFVDRTGLYFFTTQMGKGVVDERHPRCLGTAALSDNDYLHRAIRHADLIVNVGHDVTEKPPFFMHEDQQQVVHVAYYPAQMDDVYFPQHEVIGCTAANMSSLASMIVPPAKWEFGYYERVKEQIERHVYAKSDSQAFPLIPQRIVGEVREALRSDAIISLDNGMYKIWFARNYKAHQPNTVLLDNALATMGAGLPGAIAAKLVRPEQQVVAICGDGGFMMNSQEMETAVRLGLNLAVIVLRDDAYGMIEWKQAGLGLDGFGLKFGNPDFVRYAEAYGAKGIRITEPGQLRDALRSCLNGGGVHLIEVPIDYVENERVFYEELEHKTQLL